MKAPLKFLIMSLIENNVKYLEMLGSTYYNVLFDHTTNDITIFESENGLDPIQDLGEGYEDWLVDDLYTYQEMLADELQEFVGVCSMSVVWLEDHFAAETHGY